MGIFRHGMTALFPKTYFEVFLTDHVKRPLECSDSRQHRESKLLTFHKSFNNLLLNKYFYQNIFSFEGKRTQKYRFRIHGIPNNIQSFVFQKVSKLLQLFL